MRHGSRRRRRSNRRSRDSLHCCRRSRSNNRRDRCNLNQRRGSDFYFGHNNWMRSLGRGYLRGLFRRRFNDSGSGSDVVVGVIGGFRLFSFFLARSRSGFLHRGFDRRGSFDGGAAAVGPFDGAEPLAHGGREPQGNGSLVVGGDIGNAFVAELGEDRLALDAKLFGKLINSYSFDQTNLLKKR